VAALELQRALLVRTIRAVIGSGLDAELWIDGDARGLPPHPFHVRTQRDGDLGERMLQVCADIGGRGRSAIVIGSDCPVLDATYLQAAAAALRDGADVVIGPAEDGGYVLIGMVRPRPELLLQMTWGTPSVHVETLRRAVAAKLRTIVLPRLWDVDDAAGLHRWQKWENAKPDR
jgi:rSAM/selenodomain-associated transferase 1